MGCFWTVLVVFPVVISVIIFHLGNIPVINLCELATCPYCYGDSYCNEFKDNITLNYYSFSDVVFNLISVKNVYFGKHGNNNVVIKKLVHNKYFSALNKDVLKFTNVSVKFGDLQELLKNKTDKFQVCDHDTSKLFLESLSYKNISHLWTLLRVNVEPLILEVFPQKDNWPVPKLLGYCGRCVAIENCGIPISALASFSWYDRAFVALQLLSAAESFTFDHMDYRLYLLDVSPDNIAVNPSNLHANFVDLEHVLLQRKIAAEVTYHYTYHIADENYAFSTEEICSSHVSDHNVYSICRLLLSQNSPWPMMNGGLLHSPPSSLDITKLSTDIDLCVNSANNTSRFFYSKEIKEQLKFLLREQKRYKI